MVATDGGAFGRSQIRGIGGGNTLATHRDTDSLLSTILNFLQKEKIKIKIKEVSDQEFWLESIDGLIVIKFAIDAMKRRIFYDVYSTEYEEHLKIKNIRDVEQLSFISEENRRWKLAEEFEDIWLIFDEIELWAQKNKFRIIEKEMI